MTMSDHKTENVTLEPIGDRLNSADTLGRMLGEIVKALHRQFKKQFNEFAGGQALTVPQLFLLRQLVQSGPSSISDLAEKLNLANSTVSGIVDRLERDGFVSRTRDKVDRRIVYVHLTEHAERFKAQVPEFQKKFLTELLQGVDEVTLQDMLTSFGRLHDLIQRFEKNEQ